MRRLQEGERRGVGGEEGEGGGKKEGKRGEGVWEGRERVEERGRVKGGRGGRG